MVCGLLPVPARAGEKAGQQEDKPWSKTAKLEDKEATYEYPLKAGHLYRLEMKSDALDARLGVRDKEGRLLAFDDDSGEKRNARLLFVPTETGPYTLIRYSVGGAWSRAGYTIRGSCGNPTLARRRVNSLKLLPGQGRRKGSFQQTHPIDLKAGQDSTHDRLSNQFDPILRVEDEAGNLVGADDDSAGNFNARPFFCALKTVLIRSLPPRSRAAISASML